jgi:hypothetical protein
MFKPKINFWLYKYINKDTLYAIKMKCTKFKLLKSCDVDCVCKNENICNFMFCTLNEKFIKTILNILNEKNFNISITNMQNESHFIKHLSMLIVKDLIIINKIKDYSNGIVK